ncbi:TPA: ParA family protein [Vibrio vulnificus]|uniref:ParA family protein n=1 Tax=Vibrio vulnificus TaxID=672 RepID=A0A8H9N3M5_VIBVL|nr:ParA family protein [Vibrio vulnificus]HAS8542177.1 ParA family protein [Vibrio vulnificus]
MSKNPNAPLLADACDLRLDIAERIITLASNYVNPEDIPRDVFKHITYPVINELVKMFGDAIPKYFYHLGLYNGQSSSLKASEIYMSSMIQESTENKGQLSTNILSKHLFDSELFKMQQQIDEKDKEIISSLGLPVELLPLFDNQMLQDLYRSDSDSLTKLSNGIAQAAKKRFGGSNPHITLGELSDIRREFQDLLKLSVTDILPLDANGKKTPIIINVGAKKGGVGKSQVTLGLAGAFSLTASRSYKVLIIDTDSQATATHLTAVYNPDGTKKHEDKPTIFDGLIALAELRGYDREETDKAMAIVLDSVVPSNIPNVDVIQSGSTPFDTVYKASYSAKGAVKPDLLKHLINIVQDVHQYDFVLIDSRPDLHTAAVLSYAASHKQITVMRPCGEDRDAHIGYVGELACDVIPVVANNEHYTPPQMNIVFNQVGTAKANFETMFGMRYDLASLKSVMNITRTYINNDSIVTSAGTMDKNIWNIPKESISGVSQRAAAKYRAHFTQLALELEHNIYKENKALGVI